MRGTCAIRCRRRTFPIVAYDFGMKYNILRRLRQHGFRVQVVPATTEAADALRHKPAGVFLSNGPGDPAALGYAVRAVADLVKSGVPIFGICLGHQILGLAFGGRTFKLKFGHRGGNQPVKDLASGGWRSPRRTTGSRSIRSRCREKRWWTGST